MNISLCLTAHVLVALLCYVECWT